MREAATDGGVGPARVAALDGLRALAVLAVLCFHAQFRFARGGFLGVSAFFTLSGYLITTLLLREHDRTGRVSLRSFWARRARRLLPAAFLALAIIVAFGAVLATPDQLRALRGDVVGALAYSANWRFYFAGQSYEHVFSAPSPALHFWSLAIEEQFYLLFPLLMLVALRLTRGRRALLAIVMGAAALASVTAGAVLVGSAGTSRVYYGTDTRAAELLAGALLAVALSPERVRALGHRARTIAIGLGTVALVAMALMWTTVTQQSRWLYRGGFALHAALTACVIVAALVPGRVARVLSWKPFALVGLVSYGIYLFHWPIFLWLSPERTGLAAAPLFGVRLLVTAVVVTASFLLLERPLLRGRAPRRVSLRVVVPVGAAVVVVTLLAVTWSPPAPDIVLTALDDHADATTNAPVNIAVPLTQPIVSGRPAARARPARDRATATAAAPRPLYRVPASPRPLRMLVVGDSVGITVGRGFELWARAHGGVVVDNAAQKWCPLGRALPLQAGLTVDSHIDSCDWTDRWRSQIASFDPDVVIVMFTIWEGSPRQLPGVGWRAPGDPALDRWQLTEYQAAADVLGARGASVLWFNVPCTDTTPLTHTDEFSTVDDGAIVRLHRTRPTVHAVDLAHEVCPGGRYSNAYRGVTAARPDGVHFSDAGAQALADWAMPFVLGQAALPPYRAS